MLWCVQAFATDNDLPITPIVMPGVYCDGGQLFGQNRPQIVHLYRTTVIGTVQVGNDEFLLNIDGLLLKNDGFYTENVDFVDPEMEDEEAEALFASGYVDDESHCYTGQGVMRWIDTSATSVSFASASAYSGEYIYNQIPIFHLLLGLNYAHILPGVGKLQRELAEMMPGVPSDVARDGVVAWLEQHNVGRSSNAYKLRDWLFSRQRYWGEPFPITYDVDDLSTPLRVSDADLPVALPEMTSYEPAGDGEPPLATAPADWLEFTCEETGRRMRRETLTMPQWAGSCWYYLRFTDPWCADRLVGEAEEKYWLPVDLYVGGGEHATLHLLYARFWHKALYDLGVVSTKEPFGKLVCQGMILGPTEHTAFRQRETGEWVSADDATQLTADERMGLERVKVPEADVVKPSGGSGSFELVESPGVAVESAAHKMSKSRGNVVNPNTVIDEFGADSLRLYIMFMGPVDAVKPWDTSRVSGVHRFLSRAWRLYERHGEGSESGQGEMSTEQQKELHACATKVTTELEAMRYNNAVSTMMSFVNAATKWDTFPLEGRKSFALMLAPFAPHMSEELWQRQCLQEGSVHLASWPEVEPPAVQAEEMLTIAVQVNGKTRGVLELPEQAAQEESAVLEALRADEKLVRNIRSGRICFVKAFPGLSRVFL